MWSKKGQHDLQQKILRTVGTCFDTFNRSPSRYFRLLRFIHRFNMEINEELSQYLGSIDFYEQLYV